MFYLNDEYRSNGSNYLSYKIENIKSTLKIKMEDGLTSKCELVLNAQDEQHFNQYILFVIAKGRFNPATRPYQVKDAISGFLKKFREPIFPESCLIYLDLFEVRGKKGINLYQWDLFKSMDLFEVDSANIEPIVEEYLYEYYNDNLTLFTSTTFPRTDKVDLAALAIANSLTDDYTANKTVEKFKSRLHDYIKSPSNLAEQVFGRKKKSMF